MHGVLWIKVYLYWLKHLGEEDIWSLVTQNVLYLMMVKVIETLCCAIEYRRQTGRDVIFGLDYEKLA